MMMRSNNDNSGQAPQDSRWDGYTPGSKRDLKPRSVLRHDPLSESVSGTEAISVNHRTTNLYLRSHKSSSTDSMTRMKSSRMASTEDQEDLSPTGCRRRPNPDNTTEALGIGEDNGRGGVQMVRKRSFKRLPSNSSLGSGFTSSAMPSNEDQEEPSATACHHPRNSDNMTEAPGTGENNGRGGVQMVRKRSFKRLPSNSSLGSGFTSSGMPSNEDQEELYPTACRQSYYPDNATKALRSGEKNGGVGSGHMVKRRSFKRLPSNSSLGSGLIRASSSRSCESSKCSSTGQHTGESSSEVESLVTQSDHGSRHAGAGADLFLRRQLELLEAETMNGNISLCSGAGHHDNRAPNAVWQAKNTTAKQTLATQSDHGDRYFLPQPPRYHHHHHHPNQGAANKEESRGAAQLRLELGQLEAEIMSGNASVRVASAYGGGSETQKQVHVTVNLNVQRMDDPNGQEYNQSQHHHDYRLEEQEQRHQIYEQHNDCGESTSPSVQPSCLTDKQGDRRFDHHQNHEGRYSRRADYNNSKDNTSNLNHRKQWHQAAAPPSSSFRRTKTIESVRGSSPRSIMDADSQPLRRAKSNDDIGPRYPMRRSSFEFKKNKSIARSKSPLPKAA